MIDVWLLVSEPAARTSEFHGDIKPLRRIHPDLPNERAGAAAIIARMLAEFCELKASELWGLGLWDPSDELRWTRLGASTLGGKALNSRFTLRRLRTVRDSPVATILKVRVLHQAGERARVLRKRFDQEPDPSEIELSPSGLGDAGLVRGAKPQAVVIADFVKGAVTPATVAELHRWAPSSQVPWFVETKSLHAPQLFAHVRIDTLFLNRNEASRLAQQISSKAREIPAGPQPTKELFDVANAIFKRMSIQTLVITLGRDGAAAFRCANSTSSVQMVLALPQHRPEDYDGVSAGDVFVGRWVAERLRTRGATLQQLLLCAGQTAHR
jgi:bifunctional ADP-heptose synthase (sugar kinase/adenylyltransferase)